MEQDDYKETQADSRKRRQNQDFRIGDLIAGRYEFVCDLGRGGMGNVYLCRDLLVQCREMALKTVPDILKDDKIAITALIREYDNLYKLTHDSIVAVRNLVQDEFRYYVVMDYVEGETLEKYLRNNPKPGLAVTLEIVNRLATALNYAHDKNMIHLDVKPGNVIVQIVGETVKSLKLLDFGLGIQIRESVSKRTGDITGGTPAYMSPEQWDPDRFGAPSYWSDQYSLAALTYEMLAGEIPFANRVRYKESFREAVYNDKPAKITDIPDYINDALQKALSKNPRDRFKTCWDFAATLMNNPVTGSPKFGKKMQTHNIPQQERHGSGVDSVGEDLFELYRALLGGSEKYHENRNSQLAAIFSMEQRRLRNLLEIRTKHPLTVAIVELTSSGKNYLTSALLKMEAAKSKLPVEYQYSWQRKARADFSDFMTSRCITFENSKELQAFVEQFSNMGGALDNCSLSVQMPSDLLKDDLVIMDAPTFGTSILGDFKREQEVVDYLSRADYVFWVISSKQGITPNARSFYDTFLASHCMEIVVNCTDEMSVYEKAALERKYSEALEAKVDWHFVDAKSAFQGKISGDLGLIFNSGIFALERRIKDLTNTDDALMQLFADIEKEYNRYNCSKNGRYFVEHIRLELELQLKEQQKKHPNSSMLKQMLASITYKKHGGRS